ncbi:Ion channel [Nocardia amikacinitolerans]|nr:Ion channel [Nocardia amikacinitolerans]
MLRNVAALVCALLFFYGVPMEWDLSDDWSGQWLGLAAFLAGVGGLIWLATRRVRRYLREPRATGGRVDGLLLMLCVVVMFFAIYYYRLAVQYPGEFDGLVTRTDALYYTIVTLGTVGYGDIHAVGQTARIATMVQIVFDLVVIGSLLAIVSTGITHRMEEAARQARATGSDNAPPRADGTGNPRPQDPTGDR